MARRIGYARVSTAEQSLALQTDALEKDECDRLFTAKVSGSRMDRPGLKEAMSHLRAEVNHHHRHSGIGMMTPASVHEGRAEEVHVARQEVLDQAFQALQSDVGHVRPTPESGHRYGLMAS